jgi:hypothetical protein
VAQRALMMRSRGPRSTWTTQRTRSGCEHADCDDAVRVFAVVEEDGCGIDEGRCCFIKTDSVLCEIRGGLRVVPLEVAANDGRHSEDMAPKPYGVNAMAIAG